MAKEHFLPKPCKDQVFVDFLSPVKRCFAYPPWMPAVAFMPLLLKHQTKQESNCAFKTFLNPLWGARAHKIPISSRNRCNWKRTSFLLLTSSLLPGYMAIGRFENMRGQLILMRPSNILIKDGLNFWSCSHSVVLALFCSLKKYALK